MEKNRKFLLFNKLGMILALVFILTECKNQIELDNSLQVAVSNNNLEAVKKALKSGANANYRRTLDSSLLYNAIVSKNPEIAVELINYNANIHEKISQEQSLFLVAVQNGMVDIVRAMAEKGIDLNQTTAKKETALILAAKLNQTSMVEFLIRNNVKIFATDQAGVNALWWAQVKNSTASAQLIQKAISELNTANMYLNFNNIVELEKSSKTWQLININSQDALGRTLLINACFQNKTDAVSWLMKNGAKKDIKDNFGYSAEDYAKNYGNKKVINILNGTAEEPVKSETGAGANIDNQTQENKTNTNSNESKAVTENRETQQTNTNNSTGETTNQNETKTTTNSAANTSTVNTTENKTVTDTDNKTTTVTKVKTQAELDKEEFERKKKILEDLKYKESFKKPDKEVDYDY